MFDGSGWWMVVPMVFMVLVILMIFGFWRRGSGMWMDRVGGYPDEASHRSEGTMAVLRRRYAAGDLTDGQFDAMRRKLEDNA
ncbi:MAG: hypothetical protein V3W36_01900 [Acidimicrobiia bacterium]